MPNNFQELVDEILKEDMEIIDEFIREEIQPLIDYNLTQEKKLGEKAYKEILELEEEL